MGKASNVLSWAYAYIHTYVVSYIYAYITYTHTCNYMHILHAYKHTYIHIQTYTTTGHMCLFLTGLFTSHASYIFSCSIKPALGLHIRREFLSCATLGCQQQQHRHKWPWQHVWIPHRYPFYCQKIVGFAGVAVTAPGSKMAMVCTKFNFEATEEHFYYT